MNEIPDVAIPSGTHYTSCGYQDGRACTCARTEARIKADRISECPCGYVPEAVPGVQRVQQWCGYVIGAVLVACVLVVILAATFAAVRALL